MWIGETLGCGVTREGAVYFTKDGVFLGITEDGILKGSIYAIICVHGKGATVSMNWKGPFVFEHEHLLRKIYNYGGTFTYIKLIHINH